MARKGENIFKRKDGRWEGRYIKSRENGKAVYGYVFGKSYSEAKKKKAEAMACLSSSAKPTSHKALRVRPLSQVSGQPLMRDVAYQWLEELKAIRRRSTVTKYESQLRNYIIPDFGDKHVDEIRNNDLISFTQKLLRKPGKSGRPLSSRTVADIIARMRALRKFSMLHGYEVNFASDCTEIPQRSEKIRVLSMEEEKKLVAYLKENFNLTSLGIILSLFTGHTSW